MDVVFSHGKESGPNGQKITTLAAIAELFDCNVHSVDYRGIESPEDRSDKLSTFIENLNAPLLVGSSMGGYVSLRAACKKTVSGLFLMAPAVYLPGYQDQEINIKPAPMTIVHAWQDEVVPVENVLRFASHKKAKMLIVTGSHSLNENLSDVSLIFKSCLQELRNERT